MDVDLDVHLPALVAGDPVAFGRWLAGAERPLRESLRSLAHRLDAEAVLQEAMLRVWQVAPRCALDGKPNALLRLGLRITRNLAIDELRRARATPTDLAGIEAALLVLQDSGELARPQAPDPLLRRAILECRDALPAKPSRALSERLASRGGDDDDKLAARAGMRKNTFLQNFTRARKLLAECLRKRGVELPSELA